MTNHGPDELDKLIDRALGSYTSSEPAPGIERRVISRIRGSRTRFPVGWPFLAAPALGLLALAFIAPWPARRSHPPAPLKRPPEQAEMMRAQPVRREVPQKRRKSSRAGRMPKKPVFPSPVPITPEERTLIAFVEHHPAEAEREFLALRKSAGEPLEIQPIQITPLREDEIQYGDQKEEDRNR